MVEACDRCSDGAVMVRLWYSDGTVMVQGKTDQHARQIHILISHEVIIGAAIISVTHHQCTVY